MSAQILILSPKGSVWLVYHRQWRGGGETTDWALVQDYAKGLTAHEAWEKARLGGRPTFDSVNLVQLEPFPATKPSDVTKPLAERAQEAFARLASPEDHFIGGFPL